MLDDFTYTKIFDKKKNEFKTNEKMKTNKRPTPTEEEKIKNIQEALDAWKKDKLWPQFYHKAPHMFSERFSSHENHYTNKLRWYSAPCKPTPLETMLWPRYYTADGPQFTNDKIPLWKSNFYEDEDIANFLHNYDYFFHSSSDLRSSDAIISIPDQQTTFESTTQQVCPKHPKIP